ncbi:MAG: response regulator [Anaerolineae bacterium]|jgi:signal transduction histidine kinase
MAESPGAHILLMEDDPGLARLLQKRLAREGYRLDIARDGEEGLAMHDAGSYDLLIMDQVMPVYTGLEVIRILSERGPLPPIIMVTGTGSEQIAVKAMKLGAGDYIVKDVDGGYFDLLPTVIEQVLQQRRLVEEKERASAALQESHRRLKETLAQLQAAQEQVIQQERLAAVGQLAAGIAHDFNSLLTSIILSAEMLQRDPNMPETAAKNLDLIVTQSQRTAHLIQQLLDFSRKSIRRLQPLDLASLLQDLIRDLAPSLPGHIRVIQEISPGTYPLRADLGQMRQILVNLTDNACDAMPHGGQLTFRLSTLHLSPGDPPPCPEMSPGTWWALSVSDTGVGIPPEALTHLFEPFFTTKAVGKGVGLGLAQVYGIVRQHEGHIDVISQVENGATFTIYLRALIVE